MEKFSLKKVKSKRRKKFLKVKEISEGTETEYGVLNLTVSGYDMTLVSHYTQYAHHLCNHLKIPVSRSYGLPTRTTEILLMKEHSAKLVLKDLSATMCPLLIEVLLKNQPEGVDLSLKQHTQADFQARFKSRPEMEELLAQLNN
ncbi:39S ribosomal protein L48, mitochondrial-like [Scleropages formosus]|uniref:39S ribosomal protein L48, mitochondrial-like n=1 Tax=Scleropages formosus TaxID=113540 RepID=A0A0P7XDN7_SCLFO|nr:39S ribosomal protein L48, mitochondrial-like [Scleropages formosus]